MKKVLLVSIFMLISLMVVGDEYTDAQTNVLYTYDPNTNAAGVKAGRMIIIGGNGEELSEEIEPGSLNVTENITILDNFEIDGYEYTVDNIGDYAFYLTKITKVVIPKTILSIGTDAFAFCDLHSVVTYIEDPFDTDAFRYLNTSNVTLYVPNGCMEKYKTTKGWSDFKSIVEMKTTNIQFIGNLEQVNKKEFIMSIQGRRINGKPTKGVYIESGRKVVTK